MLLAAALLSFNCTAKNAIILDALVNYYWPSTTATTTTTNRMLMFPLWRVIWRQTASSMPRLV